MDERVKAGNPLTTQPSMTPAELIQRYSSEEACKETLRDLRWPDGVRCPRCNRKEKVYALKSRPFHWVCKNDDCGKRSGYRFSVIIKTVFENTNYPLKTWFQVICLMTQSKKGISALQIHRQIGSGDYRTAWYMCIRIRAAMKDEGFPRLMGQVEVDETYVSAKNKHRHRNNRSGKSGSASDKTPVVGDISRKGNVLCQMVERADARTLTGFVRKTVSDKADLVATDEALAYGPLNRIGYPHKSVTHSAGEYVRGKVHTQNLDSFWSLLKRGIVGTFHNVSKDYLPLYLNEFSFRHNNHRNNPDIFKAVLAGC